MTEEKEKTLMFLTLEKLQEVIQEQLKVQEELLRCEAELQIRKARIKAYTELIELEKTRLQLIEKEHHEESTGGPAVIPTSQPVLPDAA